MYPTIPTVAFDTPPFPELVSVVEIPSSTKPTTFTKTQKLAGALACIGLLFLAISYGPSVYYALKGSERITQILRSSVSAKEVPLEKKYSYQPLFDNSLPETNSISIPAIGVKTTIEEALDENFEDALKKGVWRVNDFGTPYNREQPTIIAAHRYGYLNWSLDFRLHHSFYNLPKLEPGDTIEIVWRQRKYVYAVYNKETTEQISDYSADLILYTCEDLSSDKRVAVYAKLLNI